MYIADYEKVLREVQDGGIVVERMKLHTLAHVDDTVIYGHHGGDNCSNERNDENNKQIPDS